MNPTQFRSVVPFAAPASPPPPVVARARFARGALVAACALALVACGGGDQDDATESVEPAAAGSDTRVALAATATAAATAPVVTSFTVVDATTGADIATFTGAGTLSLAQTPQISVRANVVGASSVVFVEGRWRRTETAAPFALRGDSGGHYVAWSPTAGTHVITATPYSGSAATGAAGASATLRLTLTHDAVAPPPPPPPPPPQAPPPTGPYDVSSLVLVNASTGAVLRPLRPADTLDLSDLGAANISIQALTNTGAKSVKFESAAAGVSRVEGGAPWAFLGNSGSTYTPWKPEAKTYTITATGYSESGASGIAGRPATVTVTVTSAVAPPPPPPPAPPPPSPPTGSGVAHVYPATAGPDRNPHKGWNSGWFTAQAESSVGFQYLAWKDFEPVNGKFDFAKVEEILARAGSKGTHFVLRLYCDWEIDDAESDCPTWMYSQVGVRRLNGDNGTRLTDFNDPKFLDEAVQAIQALAQRYDGDPRVHAFQMGVLGCWGEWHDCSFKQNGVDFEISDASKARILQAYQAHFKKSPVQGRYPWREPMKSAGFIGYHNDFFIPNDKHSNEFDAALKAGGQWQNGPIGGEAPPRKESEARSERTALFSTSAGTQMIETGRYSTMKPGDYRPPPGTTQFSDYMRLHRLMGYNFRIDRATFADVVDARQSLPVRVDARNVGVARLYRAWNVQFALLDATGRPVKVADAPVDLGGVGPGSSFSAAATLDRTALAAGTYRLALRLVQPGAVLPKPQPWGLDARNAYILFANDLPVIDGQWAADHSLVGGWSVLGRVILR